jgi:hypothetical protein
VVESYGLDGEGASLGAEISAGLASGRLYNHTILANLIVTGGFESGVQISAPSENIAFAECLADALTKTGHLKEVRVNGPKKRECSYYGRGSSDERPLLLQAAERLFPEHLSHLALPYTFLSELSG